MLLYLLLSYVLAWFVINCVPFLLILAHEAAHALAALCLTSGNVHILIGRDQQRREWQWGRLRLSVLTPSVSGPIYWIVWGMLCFVPFHGVTYFTPTHDLSALLQRYRRVCHILIIASGPAASLGLGFALLILGRNLYQLLGTTKSWTYITLLPWPFILMSAAVVSVYLGVITGRPGALFGWPEHVTDGDQINSLLHPVLTTDLAQLIALAMRYAALDHHTSITERYLWLALLDDDAWTARLRDAQVDTLALRQALLELSDDPEDLACTQKIAPSAERLLRAPELRARRQKKEAVTMNDLILVMLASGSGSLQALMDQHGLTSSVRADIRSAISAEELKQ